MSVKQPNQRVLLAMRRLSQTDAGFQDILAWLADAREDQVRTLVVNRDQWTTAQHQGAIQAIDVFLDSVQKSQA